MTILSVREQPHIAEEAVRYIQDKWASDESRPLYRDCIVSALSSDAPLPQWYLLRDGDVTVGCAGLIPNDFISRMDLWPWLCALYVEESHRGNAYGARLIERAKQDAAKHGFGNLYLCTDLEGYYERYGFSVLAPGYHPWGESTTIYTTALNR